MRTNPTPSDPPASRWQPLVTGALAERSVVTTEAEVRRLARTLERLEGAARSAIDRAPSTAARDLRPDVFCHTLDELAGD